MFIIRPETHADIPAIRRVNEQAFGRPNEGHLVDSLRAAAATILSLVAEEEGHILGHILFSPVTVGEGEEGVRAAALGPMAVLPEYQNRGIGVQLVQHGLDTCRQLGHDVVIVLGHPNFYPRFGFRPAPPLGIRYSQPLPEGVFMVGELRPDALRGVRGVVHYHPAFADV
jgi:putative acetyltransferase